MGTSSWSFPGWAGAVWDREVSAATLARHGLTAYVRHPLLRCVGVDRGYYEPVPVEVLRSWAGQADEDFRFVVKADRRLVFPAGPGSDPDLFLNPAWAADQVTGPLGEILGRRVGAVLFQFPPLDPRAVGGPRRFAEELYRFLHRLDSGLPVAVEIRTPALLTRDYGAALRHGGAVHGYVVHPEMAGLAEQLRHCPPASGAPALIRWMLQPGFAYAQAKEAWAPFRDLRRPDPTRRGAVARAVTTALEAGAAPFVVVNNKAEGSAPGSIMELARMLAGDGATS